MSTYNGQGRRGGGFSSRGAGWVGFTSGGTGYSKPKKDSGPDISKIPLGNLVTNLSYSDVTETKCTDSVSITDCEYVASYNWLNMAVPTILVPGKLFSRIKS